MNRRYFLGAALTVATAPAFARSPADRPRALQLHHMHTDQRISLVYRIGDRYQRGALAKLNEFLKDFRTGEAVPIDPQLFDILYDVKAHLGDPDARYEVLSAYRSPRTNSMLRRTSHGVARNSMHLYGQAMDIRFPDLGTHAVRDAALAIGRGGVGCYPSFVHVDTGKVRRWGA
jgi:uncharacterized protein YcbK (DUF882 family)